MTITSETTTSTLFTGNGVTTAFASGFKILENPESGDAEVEVYQLEDGVESLVSSADYTVTDAGVDAGGTITFDTAPADGVNIIIKSAVSKTQATNLRNQGASFRETYEEMVDRTVRMVQEQDETIGRALTVSITSGEEGSSVAPEDGKVLGWDGTSLANLTPNTDTYLNISAFMETMLDDTSADAALTTLGVSTYAKTLLDDTTAGGALTTLGVSAFAQTILDDATAADARTTLGALGASDISSPKFHVKKSGTQAVTTSETLVVWGTEDYDTNNNFATNRFTPTVAGYYHLTVSIELNAATDAQQVYISIWKNGARHRDYNGRASGTASQTFAFSTDVVANGSTDYFEVYTTLGVGQTISANATTYFCGHRII